MLVFSSKHQLQNDKANEPPRNKNKQNDMCAQRRLRSAWASAQSDQSLRCPHVETVGPQLSIGRTVKTLIRLGGSESSLGAHSFCWFCHVVAQMHFISNEHECAQVNSGNSF